jgi:hypothetical protein
MSVVGWLLGPVFRWFMYRSEVRLWMEKPMDELDAPIPFELVTSDE